MTTTLSTARLRVCEKAPRKHRDLIGEWLRVLFPALQNDSIWRIGLVLGCRVKKDKTTRTIKLKIYLVADDAHGLNEAVGVWNLTSLVWELARDCDIPNVDDVFIGSRVAIPCMATYPTKEMRRKARQRFRTESVAYYEAFIVARACTRSSERMYKFVITDEEDPELMMKIRHIPYPNRYPDWCISLKMIQADVEGVYIVTWSRYQ